jgi:hypothetical protein
MVKKRKPGGGRKPNPNKRLMFSTRLEPQTMAALKAGAETFPGKSISAFAEFLIDRGLREREQEERDPALRALLFLIGKLAENITGVIHITDKGTRLRYKRKWHSDQFYFRAFKVAVGELLNAMEEPPPMIPEKERLEVVAETAEEIASPELAKLFIDVNKSPGAYGAYAFMELWTRAGRSDPLSEEERDLIREQPHLGKTIRSYFYHLPQARAALELSKSAATRTQKPKTKKTGD